MPQNPFDNAGPPIPGAPVNKVFAPTEATFVDAAREDMTAFDSLGPLTRAVMRDMAVRFFRSPGPANDSADVASRSHRGHYRCENGRHDPPARASHPAPDPSLRRKRPLPSQ